MQKISDQYSKKKLYEKLFKKKFQKLLAEGKNPMRMTLEQFVKIVEFQ